MGQIPKGRRKEILKGKADRKTLDICNSTEVKLWFKYPQYSIGITIKELTFAYDLHLKVG